MENLIFGVATATTQSLTSLLIIGYVFDWLNLLLFKE